MILTDVNVLLYAFRAEMPNHGRYSAWLADLVNGDEAYGAVDVVLSGFLRIATHPRIFTPPAPIEVAIEFADRFRRGRSCVPVAPGPRHWGIFTELCRLPGVKGNTVPDAFLAALAIETDSDWITTDRGYARFPGLRWRVPW